MKKNIVQKLLFAILASSIVILSGSNLWAACSNPLLMGWEPWEPYQYQINEQLTGLDIELIRTILKNSQCDVTFKEMPWKRHLTEIEKGRVDLAAGASKTSEREVYANYSAPYRTESAVLYVRKGESNSLKYAELKDIINSSFRLGVARGYYYGENYAQLLKQPKFKAQIHDVTDGNLNYKKLLKKRIDGFLDDPFAATARLRREGLQDQIEIHPMKIYSDDIFVMFSKKSVEPGIIDAFNQSLEQLKANGVYQQVVDKYLK